MGSERLSNRPTATQLASGGANGETGADSSAGYTVRPGASGRHGPQSCEHPAVMSMDPGSPCLLGPLCGRGLSLKHHLWGPDFWQALYLFNTPLPEPSCPPACDPVWPPRLQGPWSMEKGSQCTRGVHRPPDLWNGSSPGPRPLVPGAWPGIRLEPRLSCQPSPVHTPPRPVNSLLMKSLGLPAALGQHPLFPLVLIVPSKRD